MDKTVLADQLDREVSRSSNLSALADELRNLGGLENAESNIQKRIDELNGQKAELERSIAEHQATDHALVAELQGKRADAEKQCAQLREDADNYSRTKRADADQILSSAQNNADRIVNKARSDAETTIAKARQAIANFHDLAGSAV